MPVIVNCFSHYYWKNGQEQAWSMFLDSGQPRPLLGVCLYLGGDEGLINPDYHDLLKDVNGRNPQKVQETRLHSKDRP